MPIAGKPIYAGDVNTLAQLDLNRTIAQQRATQEAIAGASRGVGNLLSAKQQDQYGKLKDRELKIREDQAAREDSERMERYTFDSVQRSIDSGVLGPDELEKIIPTFKDPTRQSILKEEANAIRGLEEIMDEEGPQVANRLNQATAYEQRTLERARKELEKAQAGWKVPGIGWGPGSEVNVEDAMNRVAMAESALQQKESALYEAYPHFQNRFQLSKGGYIYLPKRKGGRGMASQADALPDIGGSGATPTAPGVAGPPASGSPAPEEPLPPSYQNQPQTPKGASDMDVLPLGTYTVGGGFNGYRRIPQMITTDSGPAYSERQTQEVQPTTETELTPSQGTPSQGQLPANISDRLDQETLNEFYSRMAQFQRQGMSQGEARRRAGLWLQQQIDAGVF
jgi:DNA-binding transcriptional ArsR family regulator